LVLGLPSTAKPELDAAAKADIDKATKAIEASPTAINYAERGRLYSLHKMYKEAVEDRSRAVKLDPKNPHRYEGLALTLYDLNRYDDALKNCNIALTLSKRGDPDYRGAMRVRSGCYQKLGRIDDAIADARELHNLGDPYADSSLQILEKETATGQR
jgi:tetratricopeptide (TPR) repeat protein